LVSSVTIIRTLGLLVMANLLSMKALQIAGADVIGTATVVSVPFR
jgi:hypothetical protein